MGLTDKLTELDQYIWKQHEKVTQYCNKELGWDKYDLAGKSFNGATLSFAGIGIYLGVAGIETQHYGMLGLTGLFSVISYASNFFVQKELAYKKEKELEQLIESSAVNKPNFGPERPMALTQALTCSVAGPYFISHSYNSAGTAFGLALSMCGLGILSVISSLYFNDQIMTPPKKKKTIPQAIKEKITGKVAVPQVEEAQYRAVEDIVAGE